MATTNFVNGETVVVADWLNDVDAHVYDQNPTAHTADKISFTPTVGSGLTETNVEDALNEAGAAIEAVETSVASINAAGISYSNASSGLVATNVQTAIDEVNTTATTGSIAATRLTGNIEQARLATALNSTGSAPLYGVRAYASFNSVDNTGWTYTQSGTTITMTKTAHGMTNGQIVYIDFTSGTAVDGSFVISNATANTFTVTAGAALTTSGNATIKVHVFQSGNIASVVHNALGDWTFTFTTAMPTADYAMMFGTGNPSGATALSQVGVHQAGTTAAPGANTLKTTTQVRLSNMQTNSGSLRDVSYGSFLVVG